jgi:hypothetical protein
MYSPLDEARPTAAVPRDFSAKQHVRPALSVLRMSDPDDPDQEGRRSDLPVVLLPAVVHRHSVLHSLLRRQLSGHPPRVRSLQ